MKTSVVTARVEPEIDKKLTDLARKLGIPKGEVMRRLILDAKIEARQRIVKDVNGPGLFLADFKRK